MTSRLTKSGGIIKIKQIGWYSVVYKTFHADQHGENDIPVYIDEEVEKKVYEASIKVGTDKGGV